MGKPKSARHLSPEAQRDLVMSRELNAAALLTSEGKLRAALAAGVGTAVINAHGYSTGYLENAARGILSVAAATIFAGRIMARRAGRDRILQELHLDRRDVADLERDFEEYDRKRSRQTAEAFAAYWLLKAKKAAEKATNIRQAAREATKASEWRVKMSAMTEVSTAYTGERSAISRAVVPLFSSMSVQPFRVWCSAREQTTCSRCWGAHGEVVAMDAQFSLGEPGYVHPSCGCWEDITWLSVNSALQSAERDRKALGGMAP